MRRYRSLVFFQVSLDDGPVSPLDAVFFQLFRDIPVYCVILTHQKSPSGILIDPVYDSGTENPVDPGKMTLAVSHDTVDRGSFHVSCTGMHHHVFRLVYDHKIFIFIKNIQRNILWKNVRFFEIRNFKEDVITLLRLIICFYRLSVYGNRLILEVSEDRNGKNQRSVRTDICRSGETALPLLQ